MEFTRMQAADGTNFVIAVDEYNKYPMSTAVHYVDVDENSYKGSTGTIGEEIFNGTLNSSKELAEAVYDVMLALNITEMYIWWAGVDEEPEHFEIDIDDTSLEDRLLERSLTVQENNYVQ